MCRKSKPLYPLDKTQPRGAADLRHRLGEIPGAVVEIGQPISHRIDAMLSGAQSQIAIKIFGLDLNRLFAIGKEVKEIAGSVEGTVDVNIEQQTERPAADTPLVAMCFAARGVRMGDFANAIETALGGRVVSQVYSYGWWRL